MSHKSQHPGQSKSLLHSKTLDFYSNLDLNTSNILIADEEEKVCNALSVAVRQWAQEEQRNVTPIPVTNGQQAVNYVQASHANPPLLTILDLRMPEMNGLESAQIINQIHPKKAIVITASHDEDDKELIQKADNFAHQNSHVGFVIRTNSSPFLKVALESKIRQIVSSDRNLTQENTGIFSTLSQLLTL